VQLRLLLFKICLSASPVAFLSTFFKKGRGYLGQSPEPPIEMGGTLLLIGNPRGAASWSPSAGGEILFALVVCLVMATTALTFKGSCYE